MGVIDSDLDLRDVSGWAVNWGDPRLEAGELFGGWLAIIWKGNYDYWS